jgi:hypothetical protein
MPDSPSEQDVPVVTDQNEAIETNTPDAPSESSTEKPAATMLDAVKAAIAPKEESPPSEPGKTEQVAQDPKKTEKTESEDDALSEDEFKKLSTKTQRRIKGFEKKLAAKDTEIEGFRTKAGEFDKIETFVRNAGLTNETVGATLQIAALLRHNPREALTRLLPIVNQLQNIVGETLSPELQARVQQGYLTEEDARAIARSSADAVMMRRQNAEMVSRQQAEQAQRAQRETVDSTIGSVETWEAAKAKSDPEWHLKQDDIAEQVELAIERETRKRGAPWFPSAQEAVQLSEDAYKRVNERMKRFAPRPRAIDPAIPGGASYRNVAAPKSMLEVVRQTVGAA